MIESKTRDIDILLSDLYESIDNQLLCDKKSYDITFNGQNFHLHPATTIEEKQKMGILRRELIAMILKSTLDEILESLPIIDEREFNPWDRVMALFAGPDPDDFKMNKSDIDHAMETIVSDDEKYGKSRPLNMDAFQVKMQDVSKDEVLSEN